MAMARQQVLLQIDDALLSLLDERAAAEHVSRSELVRRSLRTMLAAEEAASIDRAIARGYEAAPAPEPSSLVRALAIASIEEESW